MISVGKHELERLLDAIRTLQRQIRDDVVEMCRTQSEAHLSRVVDDSDGDTVYAIDKVSEQRLLEGLNAIATEVGGIVLVAEGIPGGRTLIPQSAAAHAWLVIVDPIDGTRGLMYQKRSAWVLTGIAPNRGVATRMSDIAACAMTEIPTLKQHLCDEVWAIIGQGGLAQRYDRLNQTFAPLRLAPSTAQSVAQGYAMISRFFPGARDILARIDDAVMHAALGPAPRGKALTFEEQYPSSGGQLYELMCGHDRFNADLRPLLAAELSRRGMPLGLCCHPYDLCTVPLAREFGVIVTDERGEPLDAPLDVDANVTWIAYANGEIQKQLEGPLQAAIREHVR